MAARLLLCWHPTKVEMIPIKTMIVKLFFHKGKDPVLNKWSQSLYNQLDNLKFLSYVTETGFPTIIPVIQTQSAGSQLLIFSTGAFTDELKAIPKGITMALFGLSRDMTDVLVRDISRPALGRPASLWGTISGLGLQSHAARSTADLSTPPTRSRGYIRYKLEK